MSQERFEIVDDDDRVIGTALRSECHGNPALVHRAAHVLVFNAAEELLLQKRSTSKDIQPGRWDTSVGGHLDPGEDYRTAALREMREELGLTDLPLTFLYRSRIRNEVESENIATFRTCSEGPFHPEPREIDALRFWSAPEIKAALGTGCFTPNFEVEWRAWEAWCRCYPTSPSGQIGLCSGETFPDLSRELDGG